MPATDNTLLPIIALTAASTYILALLLWQWRTGILSPHTFALSPPRTANLAIYDAVIPIWLWFCGSSLGAAAASLPMESAPSPQDLLTRALAAYTGALPALLYIIIRARTAIGYHFPRQAFRHTLNVTLFIIPATMLTMAVTSWIGRQLGRDVPAVAHDYLQAILDADSSPVRLGLITTAILIAPLYEELIFRGMLQTSLLHTALPTHRWTVITLASLIFTLIHLGLPPETLPGLFVLALGLGYLYERTGSICAPIAVHALFNAANVALALSGLVSE